MSQTTDSAGHPFAEIPVAGGAVRVTYLSDGLSGRPAIRVQMRDGNSGKLRRGPDIPIDNFAEMQAAALKLIVEAGFPDLVSSGSA